MPSQAERMNEERTTKKPKVAAKKPKVAAKKKTMTDVQSEMSARNEKNKPSPKKTMTDVQSEMSAKNEKNKPSAPAKAAEPAAKKQTFKEAFAANRKAGKKTFSWNGGEYTTELKKPEAKPKAAAKEAPKPAAKKKKERPDSRFMY